MSSLDSRPVALVVGGETDGVHAEVEQDADVLVGIPMASPVESLNVAVAAGNATHEIRTKMMLGAVDDPSERTGSPSPAIGSVGAAGPRSGTHGEVRPPALGHLTAPSHRGVTGRAHRNGVSGCRRGARAGSDRTGHRNSGN